MSLEVRRAEARDLPGIKRLLDNNISRDFYSIEDLEGMIRGENDLLYIVEDEDRDGMIVSFFYAFLSSLDEALRVLHVQEKPEMLKKYSGNECVGVFKTTSTDPDYRKRGLFTSFMEGLQPVLRSRGAQMIVATALHPYGREVPTRNVLRKTGFVSVSDLHRPWVETEGYCPYCRKDHCICDAVLYIREFDEKEDEESE